MKFIKAKKSHKRHHRQQHRRRKGFRNFILLLRLLVAVFVVLSVFYIYLVSAVKTLSFQSNARNSSQILEEDAKEGLGAPATRKASENAIEEQQVRTQEQRLQEKQQSRKADSRERYSKRTRVSATNTPLAPTPLKPAHQKSMFDLTAVAMFRVNFTNDLLNFTHSEIDQWMTYLEYAGVQHFYLYDNCQHEYECVGHHYQNDSRVTYIYWPVSQYFKAQNPAYEHHRIHHANEAKYEIQIDIDEYPFMPNDHAPNFLRRYAFRSLQQQQQQGVDQMLLRTWFFGGPAPETNHTWRAMRYLHKQQSPIKNGREKPLYAIGGNKKITSMAVHRANGRNLITQTADPNTIYLKHYWCERLGSAESKVHDDTIVPLIYNVIQWDEQRKEKGEVILLRNDDTNNTKTITYPLPSTGGFVHYSTTAYSGWNNQRQGAMMSWVVAYLTGHTFEFKTFHPAFTGAQADRGPYNHDELFDLEHLEKYVHVQKIPHTKTADNYDKKFHIGSVFETIDDVKDLAKHHKTITYDIGWSFMQHTYPWLDPWQEPGSVVFERMVESFTYSRLIQETADRVVAEMGDGGGENFIAIHARSGRAPALDCQDLRLETVTETVREKYKLGGCAGMLNDWDEAVARLFPNNTLPIYVATDGSLPGNALQGARRASDFAFLQSLRPAILSAVEQVISSRAEYFIASTHSSWSEYVIYKRALTKKDGKKNYDIWIKNLAIADPPPKAKDAR